MFLFLLHSQYFASLTRIFDYQGNTGGLGGVFGIFYATEIPLPAFATRPLPQIIARAQKGLLSPLTGKDVDDFVRFSAQPSAVARVVAPKPAVQERPTFVEAKAPTEEVSTPRSPPPPAAAKVVKQAPIAKKVADISEDPADPVNDAFANFFAKKTEEVAIAAPKKQVTSAPPVKKQPPTIKEDTVAKQKAQLRAAAEERKSQADKKKKETEKAALAASEDRANAARAAVGAMRQAAEEKKAVAIAANELKKKELEEKKAIALAAANAKQTVGKAKRGATISLGFFNFGSKDVDEKATKPSSKAPLGVPTISKWKQNSDGSISGFIAGSNAFSNGETITTSPIRTKNPESETVVVTTSGSK